MERNDRPRHTHFLQTAGDICQNTERNQPTEAHSLSEVSSRGRCQLTERNRPTEAHSPAGDDRRTDFSGRGKKLTDQGPLTSWRQQREGLVRIKKETVRPRPTHILETAEGGICQDTERNRPIKAHSPTGNNRGRGWSKYGKKPTNQGPLTLWRWQREELVRTRKKTDQAITTYILEMVEGGTCHDTERTDRPSPTHQLEMAEGGTCQDVERTRSTKAHLLPGDSGGRNLSGYGKKNRPTEAHSLSVDGRGRD